MPTSGRLFLVSFALISLLNISKADDPSSINSALERYRVPTTGISINVLTDEIKMRKRSTSETVIYFRSDASYEKCLLYVANYKNSVRTSAFIGDGTQLWNLDFAKKQYSVQTYGIEKTASLTPLLNAAKSQFPSQAWGGVRLLEDILIPKYPWTTWQPMMTGPQIDDASGAVIYRVGNNIEHRFRLKTTVTNETFLESVFIGEYATNSSTERNIYPRVGLPEGLNFQFKPESGWVQVVTPTSQRYVPR